MLLYFMVRNIYRKTKWFIQRGKRGFSDADTWNFNTYIAQVIASGLKSLEKNAHGHPMNVKSMEEWSEVLKKMIIGFEAAVQLDTESFALFTKQKNGSYKMETNMALVADLSKKKDEALDLFKIYFGNLWD